MLLRVVSLVLRGTDRLSFFFHSSLLPSESSDDLLHHRRSYASVALYLIFRPLMSKLVNVDIFAPDLDAETDIRHPANTPFMLAFVNITANGSVLAADDGAVLKSALTFLSNNLNERGTIVMALPDWEFPRTKLKGDLYLPARVDSCSWKFELWRCAAGAGFQFFCVKARFDILYCIVPSPCPPA